jgi:hypothetical protein
LGGRVDQLTKGTEDLRELLVVLSYSSFYLL